MNRTGRRRSRRKGAISEVGNAVLLENAEAVQNAFGNDFETVVAIFVRKKDKPEDVYYFGAMKIPDLANLVGEMARDYSIDKILKDPTRHRGNLP